MSTILAIAGLVVIAASAYKQSQSARPIRIEVRDDHREQPPRRRR